MLGLSSVLAALGERLAAALGADPWAVGHRSAALAFASRLVDDDELQHLIAHPRSQDELEVALLLQRYMSDPRDTRGFRTD
jgi:hypothetical protein